MKKGDVVTIVSMMGEVVGRLVEETDLTVTLADPRLFVPAREGSAGGFAPGVCMTGQQNLDEVSINRAVVLCVVLSHPEIESGWREAVTGLVT
jgi:hypothetical protein